MTRVRQFEHELDRRSPGGNGRWLKIDLHNHSPASFDFRGKGPDAARSIVAALTKPEQRVDVLMFTDHEVLADRDFCKQVEQGAGVVVVRGVELNCFVDAFDKATDKVDRTLYYHLLVGFDPNGDHTPEYWLEHLYRQCRAENRVIGDRDVRGIPATASELRSVLSDSGAIVIPAHLHSHNNAWKSRSVDDIYMDAQFLKDASENFTALEVTNARTAEFFDGQHDETGRLRRACIWSSDAHEAAKFGWRPSYALMERPCFDELRAALELRERVSLAPPSVANVHVVGIHVQGAFLADTWLRLAPGYNVLIGSKGSGKTSILECLRFALGTPVPTSRAEAVGQHLQAIVGPGGKVEVLVRRADGAKVLIERSAEDNRFRLTFEDNRSEMLASTDALRVQAQILGWHEIEQVATDVNIRRQFMDTIAGSEGISGLRETCRNLASEAQQKHDLVASKYSQYRDLGREIDRLNELRRGLQELNDANLIALRDEYKRAVELHDGVIQVLERVREVPTAMASAASRATKAVVLPASGTASALDDRANEVRALISELKLRLDGALTTIRSDTQGIIDRWDFVVKAMEAQYGTFTESYRQRVADLTPEARALLESHRDVLEKTRKLPDLEARQESDKIEILSLVSELEALCGRIDEAMKEQTRRRVEAVAELNARIRGLGVRLTVLEHGVGNDFAELAGQYRQGAQRFEQLKSIVGGPMAHFRFKLAYERLRSALATDIGDLLFGDRELGFYLTRFEEDDLKIELNVGGSFRQIDQLSAGQRCTAVFPVLLLLNDAPLIVDQPEDNLDNRYIATVVAPAVMDRRGQRQMLFTSHNANLVVLSDPERIVVMDSDGSRGHIECAGFLACPSSQVTKHVLEMVDGGEEALQLRYRKYGQRRTTAG